MRPTSARETAPRAHAEPGPILGALWGATLLLSVLFSSEVSSWVLHDGWLSKQGWALAAANVLEGASGLLGITRLRDGLAAILGWSDDTRSAQIPALATDRLVSVERAGDPTLAPSAPTEGVTRLDKRAARHRVLLLGESSIQFYLGSELERALRSSYQQVEVKRFGKLATSLVRSDILDWHEKASALVREFEPDLVVANFGGNDAQNIVVGRGTIVKFGTPRWDAEFADRVAALTRIVHTRGARLVMIGMPAMRDRSFSRRMKHVNAIVESEMQRAGQSYVSTWEHTVDQDGEYRKAVTVDGTTGLMRLSDGKHYSKLGARFVAERTLEKIERRFLFWPRDPELSIAVQRELASRALGQQASYLAYVPQQAAQGGTRLPVLFLLHGAGGSFEDYADHAHRELQRLSSAHDIVIVTPEGGTHGWYLDSPLVANSQYETHLVKEVLPDVQRTLPASGTRGIGGLSAGGNAAIAVALKHAGLFRSASSMSGAVDLSLAADRPALIERLGPYAAKKRLWNSYSARYIATRNPDATRRLPLLITVGSEDYWAPANRSLHAALAAAGVAHEFEESAGRHDWDYWTAQLSKHIAWHARKLRSR